MHAWRGLSPLIVGTLATIAVANAQPVSAKKRAWLTDLASAQAQARLSGKPIFAVLH